MHHVTLSQFGVNLESQDQFFFPVTASAPKWLAEAVRVLESIAQKFGHTFEYDDAPDGRLLDRCAWLVVDR